MRKISTTLVIILLSCSTIFGQKIFQNPNVVPKKNWASVGRDVSIVTGGTFLVYHTARAVGIKDKWAARTATVLFMTVASGVKEYRDNIAGYGGSTKDFRNRVIGSVLSLSTTMTKDEAKKLFSWISFGKKKRAVLVM